MGDPISALRNAVATARKRPMLWLGLGIFWCWCWMIIQSPREVAFGVLDGSILSSREYVLIVALVGFIALGLIQRFLPKEVSGAKPRIVGWVLGALYGVTVFLPKATGFSFVYADVCEVILSGILIAYFWMMWGRLLCVEGSRRALNFGSLALLISFLFALFAHALDAERQAVVRSLLPLVGMALLLYETRTVASDTDAASDVKQAFPWKLLLTLFIQGLMLGLLQALLRSVVLEKCTAPYCVWRYLFGFFGNLSMLDFCGLMSIVGFLLAFVLIMLTSHFLKMNFLHLIYLVGFPLISIGFIAVVYGPAFIVGSHPHLFGDVFVFGEIMSTAGYYYALAIAWVLCAYLTSQGRMGYGAFIWLGAALFAGQLCGVWLCRLFIALQSNSAVICIMAVFILLFSGLIFATNDRLRGEWGGASPGVADRPSLFRQACQSVADANGLTPREAELLALLARGRSTDFIHKTLFISRYTVKTHARSIYRKTNIHSQQELINLVEREIDLFKSNGGT